MHESTLSSGVYETTLPSYDLPTIQLEPIVWERIKYFKHIHRAVVYFQANLCERVTERDVAAAACLEASAFSKASRRAVGLTFRDFAEALRMMQAIEEMLTSDQPLTNIALAVGFLTLANMERSFRKRLGLTPSAYRKALLEHKWKQNSKPASSPLTPAAIQNVPLVTS